MTKGFYFLTKSEKKKFCARSSPNTAGSFINVFNAEGPFRTIKKRKKNSKIQKATLISS